jgi:hypothetical protein
MRTHRSDSGFSMSALIFFLTAASIFIAAAVPSYQMQAKREMEEELIFRGEEYARAIQKFQRRFGVYPSSLDQLISTNNLRFLRHPYKDPITGENFRIITVNPDGSLNGSKLFVRNANQQGGLFGNTQPFGQQQNGPQPSPQGQQFPQPPGQPTTQQQGGFPSPSPQQPSFGTGGGGFGGGFQAQMGGGQINQQTQQRGFQTGGQQGVVPIAGATTNPGTGQIVSGSGIIGVASNSEEKSIKVYNTRTQYDEWEFLAILNQSGQPGRVGAPNQPGANPGGNNNPFAPGAAPPTGFNPGGLNPGGFNPTNPIAAPSPIGPAGSPVGPGRTQSPVNPFGVGGVPQPQSPNQPRR